MEEILIYGSQQPAGALKLSAGSGTGIIDLIITACDLHSGSHIASFKQSSSPRNGIVATKSHIIAAQAQKALIHVYSYLKEGVDQKIVVPEKLNCITVSPCGTWLAAGGETGRLLIWELKSGQLVFARETHYQAIVCLQFTKDSAYLFTTSDDSRVFGWSVLEIVSSGTLQNEIQPAISWSDHSLPVTSLCVGYGFSNEAYVFTGSLDATIRCWSIAKKELLTTFVLNDKVTAMVVDPLERFIYAGLANGSIVAVPLYDVNPSTGYLEAVGGAKRIVTVDSSNPPPSSSLFALSQHSASVTALTLSFDGTILISGDSAGQAYSWDLTSRQVLRKLKPNRGPISSIQTIALPKSETIIPSQAKVKASKGGAGVTASQGPEPIPQLKRVLEPAEQKSHDIWIKIPEHQQTAGSTEVVSSVLKDVQQAKLHTGHIFDQGSESGLQARVQQLESDLNDLYKNYSSLQAVHEDLWSLHVQKSLG
ncbi:Ipi3p [Sugiyamaella lignohabitans]|uniref:Pre-rRNA-processing protein IPI3 n=1 Tax=Sugiyamaella lignohabitans TaxID=796027 RepID=A0A167CB20_9ASCO|nr:Ipi3p [Sugiyamaella lignohabitans]ANB11450.1 Ipi3p [Sugiyamaella lignohabitans]